MAGPNALDRVTFSMCTVQFSLVYPRKALIMLAPRSVTKTSAQTNISAHFCRINAKYSEILQQVPSNVFTSHWGALEQKGQQKALLNVAQIVH